MEFYTASTWKRLFAYWIDSIIAGFFFAPMWIPFIKGVIYQDEVIFLSWSLILACVVFRISWDVACLYFLSATPGKLLLGLKVISLENATGRLSLLQCFLRVLADQLSFFFGLAPRALAFLRLDRRHVSDWLAETKVVQKIPREKAPERRVVLAVVLVVFALFGRMVEVYRMFQQITVSASGVSAVRQPQ